MRFSEAVRAGAKLGPQSDLGIRHPGNVGSCALRAAADAIGMATKEVMLPYGRLLEVWPGLEAVVDCPACWRERQAYMTVFHLNDSHGWTREAIADWYEATFETTDDQLVQATVTAVKEAAAEKEMVEA